MTKTICDLSNVEVEHLLGLGTGLPLVKIRAESDRVVLVGQVSPDEARQIAGHLVEAAARASGRGSRPWRWPAASSRRSTRPTTPLARRCSMREAMRFFVGLHDVHVAHRFDLACISVNRLRRRKKAPFEVHRWIIDSGAFTELSQHGHYRHDVAEYAAEVRRWRHLGTVEAVVAQDFMCEPFILAKTGLDVPEHQRLTIDRYDQLVAELADTGLYVMPVLQGFEPEEYVKHLRAYGERLPQGAWVGVGSVCKRQGDPGLIVRVLEAIKAERPDLRLHGFGVKLTSLKHAGVRGLLWSADSMAWSYSARKQGRDPNDWREAKAFEAKVLDA